MVLKKISYYIIIIFLLTPGLAQAKYLVRPLDQAIYHNNRGVTFLNKGNPKKALFEFKMATEISRGYVEAWNNLGLAYMYLDQYQKAEESLQKAISIDKKYPVPYNHMASLHYNKGNYSEALNWVKKALKKDKKFADAYYNKGIIHSQLLGSTKDQKNAAEGEKAFRFALEANPQHYLANLELGNLYVKLGKLEQALFRYKAALEIQPSASQAWTQLGNLYLQQGQTQKAQFAFNKALAASPKDVEAQLSLAKQYLAEKNYALAEKQFASLAQAKSDDVKVQLHLAFAKLSRAEDVRGRQGLATATPLYQEAIQSYQDVLKKFPKATEAAYNVGYLYSRLGNSTQADQWYQKALNIQPNYPRALFSLGALKFESGQKAAGVQYLCDFVHHAGEDLQASKDAAKKMIAQHGKCR